MASEIGFHCTACGKCCNSPPAMSVAELFHHRDRFIGSLTIGRVERLGPGARIAAGAGEQVLDQIDAAELAALQDAVFHQPGARAAPNRRAGDLVSLVTQAFDYPSLARCPALASDGGCAIHHQGKPLMCRVVPLEPCVPDRLQASALLNRRASATWDGASCIEPAAGATAGLPYRPLVRHKVVAEPVFSADLQRRRADLVREKQRWGRAVFGMLEHELGQGYASRLDADARLVLPLAPVLAVLAAEGEAMRAQCLAYIDAQLALIDVAVDSALVRKRPGDRAITAQLRGFARAYARQRRLLAGSDPGSTVPAAVSGAPPGR